LLDFATKFLVSFLSLTDFKFFEVNFELVELVVGVLEVRRVEWLILAAIFIFLFLTRIFGLKLQR
jgi:hypothetical protein